MNYCTRCGSPPAPGQSVCSNCGAYVEEDRHPMYKGGEGMPYMPPHMPPRRINNSVIITIIIAAVVLINLMVIIFLWNNDKGKVKREVIVQEVAAPASDENAGVAVPAAAPVAKSAPSPEARKQSLLNDYEKILRRNPSETYFMTDLNSNGFPELWITYNVGKNADGMIHVYHGEQGSAREIYSTYFDGIATRGKYVITECGDGYWSLFTYNGSRVVECDEDLDRFDTSYLNWNNSSSLTSTRDTAPLHQSFRR